MNRMLECIVVNRDKLWFEQSLPLMQKFISDLESVKIQYGTYLKNILPEEKKDEPSRKKKKNNRKILYDSKIHI